MESISKHVEGREGAVTKTLKVHPANGGQPEGGLLFGNGVGTQLEKLTMEKGVIFE